MLKFIQNLLNINVLLAGKIRGGQAYDEENAYHSAKDYKAAFPLMLESATLGNPQAMSILGTMYLLGQGTKEDGGQAVFWLEKAIAANFADAESVLGMAYATGKAGVKIDIPKATQLLTLAAERGEEQSARMLEMMQKGEGMFRSLKTRKSRPDRG